MSNLIRPKELQERKQSHLKASNAKKIEVKEMMDRLITSPAYKDMQKLALGIANQYRNAPGTTHEQNESYLTHCTILWAYNMLWSQLAQLARTPIRGSEDDGNDGW